jgi:hypothetical protein
MSQNPKIAHFFFPPINGFISPLFIIFVPTISAPADPKTKDNNPPILTMAL